MPVLSIVGLADVLHFLRERGDAAQEIDAIAAYLARYGAGAVRD
jgi:hypothetical protein